MEKTWIDRWFVDNAEITLNDKLWLMFGIGFVAALSLFALAM